MAKPVRPKARVTPEEAVANWRKRHGDAVAHMGANLKPPARTPSGILEFDIASGGGFPVGNMSIIFGAKDSGKSTMLYKTMGTFLENNPDKIVAFLDLEGNYDSAYGQAIGIDESRLMPLFPEYGEQAGDMVIDLINTVEGVGMIALDSLAAMCSEAEAEKSMEDSVMGKQGQLISRLLKVTNNRLIRARGEGREITVIFVNQMRTNLSSMGSPNTQPGGKAPGYYAHMMVQLWGGKEGVDPDVDPNKPVTKEVKGQIVKKKGQIVSKLMEYTQVIVPHKGLRVGQTKDWSCAQGYLVQMGQLGKEGKGWQIMGHEFRIQKECRAWYEEHRAEAKDAIITYLMKNPEAV